MFVIDCLKVKKNHSDKHQIKLTIHMPETTVFQNPSYAPNPNKAKSYFAGSCSS